MSDSPAPQESKEDAQAAATPETAKPAAAAPAQPRVNLDDSHVTACYANFCRVNGTPEELIIDFGLNAQPFGASEQSLAVTQRLVVNYFTAKRLLSALHLAVQRHETAFGVLETNVQKRVVAGALRQSTGGQSASTGAKS